MPYRNTWRDKRSPLHAGGAAAVVALHAAAIAGLLQLEPVRATLSAAAPVMVQLITPTRETPHEQPKPLPVKLRVQRPAIQPQPQPQPILAAAPEAPAVAAAPPAPPAPVAPPVEVAHAAPVAALAPPPPAPMMAPRFDADYLNNPAPAYPPLSRRMGEEGKVVLRVFVNERGVPDDVQIRTSSGFPRLDGAALESVRHWKFVPARRGESPTGAWVLVPVSFSLRS